jgi:hypothetical protein
LEIIPLYITDAGHYYYIISKASGQALTVTATPGAGVGARVFQAGLGHWDTQKWGISNFNDTIIFNKFSGLVLASKARPPSVIGRPSASSWRRCGKMLKWPNSMLAGASD